MKSALTTPTLTIRQRVERCGCVVTERAGHVHTKMCDQHREETFRLPRGYVEPNLDLIGG